MINPPCSTSCASTAATNRRHRTAAGVGCRGGGGLGRSGCRILVVDTAGAVPVHVVAAQAIAGAVQPPPAPYSMRLAMWWRAVRQTVASKITAKMVELDIEEGDRVKAGQVIAKLDDTNIRAALNQAGAQLDYAKASLNGNAGQSRQCAARLRTAKSLLQSHFVSQAAVDNAQTTVDALRAQLATQRSKRRCRRARNERFGTQSRRYHRARAVFRIVTVKAAQPGEMVSPVSAGGGFTRTGIGTNRGHGFARNPGRRQ